MRMDVFLNDRKICTAGIDESGVLNASLFAHLHNISEDKPDKLKFYVGAIADNDENTVRKWTDMNLRIGDEVRIVLKARGKMDEPVRETLPEREE